MKNLLSLTLCLGATWAVNAQLTEETTVEPHICSTTEHQQELFEKHPEYKEMFEAEQAAFQAHYEEFLPTYSPGGREVKIIPVVVHVIHTGGPENISDEQIYDAIKQLNEDYSATNEDNSTTVSPFNTIIGDMEIEFRLAGKDVDGNCHKGITRTWSELSHEHDGESIVSLVNAEHGNWPQNRYMNVFVCSDIGGAAGYTNYPSDWYPLTGMYGGIYMRSDYMGAIGTSSEYREHTLSHEAGHWLNLAHLWGSTNSPGEADNCDTDDGVDDTPNTIGWSSCILSGETCGSLDNVQNILEYSYCTTMFTEGQVARVHAALSSSLAGRNNLWSASNLEATGVNGILCEADFSADKTLLCSGESLTFYDNSYHQVTSRTWTFEGGTPSTSSDENPVVTYNTPGIYSVTLEVANGGDTESLTRTNYISVFSTTGDEIPYFEGFESMTNIQDGNRFALVNENDASTWEVTDEAASLSSKSAMLSNFGVDDGMQDELISGTIDLSGVDASEDMIFSFDYSYNKRNSSNDEELRIYISSDCGESWTLRKILDSDEMAHDTKSSPYFAIWSDWWTNEVITTITSPYYVENFQYKFQFTNDNGNNIFLDNIKLYPASLANLNEEQLDFSIYPNPAQSELNILLEGVQATSYQIMDMSGRVIQTDRFESTIDISTIAEGVYSLQLTNENGESVGIKRFIKG